MENNNTSTSDIKFKLDDVIGQEEAISELKKYLACIKYKEISDLWKIKQPNGILFIGPPKVGKTMAVRALGNELGGETKIVEMNFSEIASKWYGESTKFLAKKINIVNTASKKFNVIVFIDEIDTLLRNRDVETHEATVELVTQFLVWMDGGLGKMENVTIIGTTNNIDRLDKAALRPGRFDKIIAFKDLDAKSIVKTFQMHLNKFKLKNEQLENIDWVEIEKKVEVRLMPGAAISGIIRNTLYDKAFEHSNNQLVHKKLDYKNKLVMPKPISTDNLIFQIDKYLNSDQHKNLSKQENHRRILNLN